MLDIKIIRENVEAVKNSIKKRNSSVDLDDFLEKDRQRNELKIELDKKRAIKNKVSKEIPQLNNEDKKEKIAEMKIVSDEIKLEEERLKILENELKEIHRNIPNFLHKNIIEWKDDTENVVLKTVWELKKFDFEPKDHHDLLIDKDFLDKKKAAEVTWARFYYLK